LKKTSSKREEKDWSSTEGGKHKLDIVRAPPAEESLDGVVSSSKGDAWSTEQILNLNTIKKHKRAVQVGKKSHPASVTTAERMETTRVGPAAGGSDNVEKTSLGAPLNKTLST